MKTASLAAASLSILLAASTARADHRVYRSLDDLAFAAMSDARDARWEIHDHFATSRDFLPLLEDADELMRALRGMQDSVYREDRPERMLQAIEAVHHVLTHFQEHLEQSDFASRSRGSVRFGSGGGYSYHAPSRHAGSVHVQELQRILNHLDSHLHEMEEAIDHAFGHHHHDHGPAIEGPAFPGGGQGISAPGPSAEAVSIPLLGGRVRIRIN